MVTIHSTGESWTKILTSMHCFRCIMNHVQSAQPDLNKSYKPFASDTIQTLPLNRRAVPRMEHNLLRFTLGYQGKSGLTHPDSLIWC